MHHNCLLKMNQQNQTNQKSLCKKHQNADKFVKVYVNEEVTQNVYVHELVAKAFVPNPDNLPYIEHLDGDRLNNRADNLRWTAIKPKGYRPIH